ncbi:MAG: caspase family protein [Cyanobacteria bacterium P01_A01_bin.123]
MSRDALVVGINKYHTFPGLKAPAQDANAIAHHLQIYGDFRVRRMPEIIQDGQPKIGQRTAVTTRVLESALVQLFKPEGKNVPQTALFYFSGHGFQRNAGIREGYLATSDTNPDTGNFGLSLFWLRRLLQESPVRQRVVILDCCHSGEILNFLEADPGAQSGTDRLFMAASREFEAAYESLESPLSVFTQAVLKGLDPHGVGDGVVSNHSLIGAVSQQLKGELQQPLFESSGSDIMLTRAQSNLMADHTSKGGSTIAADVSTHCPYQGLKAFTETEGVQFFGREDLTSQLLQRVNTQSFCAILGASGIGKTSLVRAGLIHQLQQGQRIPGSDRWQIKYLTPGDAPLQRLAAAFVDPTLDSVARAEQLHRAEAFLQDGNSSLSQLARASLQPLPPAGDTVLQTVTHLQPQRPGKLVLIIDQLEELFLSESSPAYQAQRDTFLQRLNHALQTPTPELTLVVVARSSSLEQLSQYPVLIAAMQAQALRVSPMTYEQIKATIIKPAQQAGLDYEQNLLYSILLDVAGAPGELALLQQTLVELWQQRQSNQVTGRPCLTMAAYTQLGGIRNLLNQRATHVFEQLDTIEKQVAQRIFLALCELGEGTEDNRRRARTTELINRQFPFELVTRILNRLASEKLIVINRETEPALSAAPLGLALPEAAWPGAGQALPIQEKLAQKLHSPRSRQPQSRYPSKLLQSYQQRCVNRSTLAKNVSPETIDIAHESLIRSWELLRQWLHDKRDLLRHQRKLETAAQDWQRQGCPRHLDYLLAGRRLSETEGGLRGHTQELSSLAESYLICSRQIYRRHRLKTQTLKVLVPCALASGMIAAWGQYNLRQSYSAANNANAAAQMNAHRSIIPAVQPAQSDRASAESGRSQPLQSRLLATVSNGINFVDAALRDQTPLTRGPKNSLAIVQPAQDCPSVSFTTTGLEAVLVPAADLGSKAIAAVMSPTQNEALSQSLGQTPIALAEKVSTALQPNDSLQSYDDSSALPMPPSSDSLEAILQTVADQPIVAIVWIAPDGTVQTYAP